MPKIPAQLAKAGFVLAKPVARADGMVVAPQGIAELTEAMLDKFDMMGVEYVVVEASPMQTDGVASGTNTTSASSAWTTSSGVTRPGPPG